MQGWRVSMEDAHIAHLDLSLLPKSLKRGYITSYNNDTNKDENTKEEEQEVVAYFGVLDGHGGDKVANYTSQQLGYEVVQQSSFKIRKYGLCLQRAFIAMDRNILQQDELKDDTSGCTATTCLITRNRIIAANVGDSRTVLSVNGHAKPLSYDHKPSHPGEKLRIQAAQDFVEADRVRGLLALSRAIGDFRFKDKPHLSPEEQPVTALPDVIERGLTPDDEFLILACDGIWDAVSSQEAVDFVRQQIAAGEELWAICEQMCDKCLAPSSNMSGIGCDNMTFMIVALLQGKTETEWRQEIEQKYLQEMAEVEESGLKGEEKTKQRTESEEEEELESRQIEQKIEQIAEQIAEQKIEG